MRDVPPITIWARTFSKSRTSAPGTVIEKVRAQFAPADRIDVTAIPAVVCLLT